MFSLANKTIVVTGGLGLIGSGIVTAIKECGGIAVIFDMKKTESENSFEVDITNPDSLISAIDSVKSKFGKIDGWINCAYPRTADWGKYKFEEVPIDSWRKNIDMHLGSYLLCCQQILKFMREQGSGTVVNVASIYGVIAPDFQIYEGTKMTAEGAYSAVKGGIISLTRYLASLYGPDGIRVNSVSPGGVFDNQPEPFLSNYNRKVPLRRMATLSDIVPPIIFLLTDEASYITGQNILVDGGMSVI